MITVRNFLVCLFCTYAHANRWVIGSVYVWLQQILAVFQGGGYQFYPHQMRILVALNYTNT